VYILLLRIITGVVGIALAAFIIQTGGRVFGAAVLALMVIGWHEYAQAFRHYGQPLAYCSGAFFVALLGACAWLGNAEEFLALTTLAVLWTMTQAVFFHRDFSVAQAVASVAGIVYVVLRQYLQIMKEREERQLVENLLLNGRSV